MTVTKDPMDAEAASEKVVAWLEDNVGGTVTHIERQARWRPVWFANVERNGERLELCVRGDRTDMPLVFPLDHEMRLQALLGDHGIPVAQVHGWIDDPMAYVMDRVPGENHFENCTDAERDAVVDDYLHILARMHALDIGPFVDGGIMRAERPEESGLLGLRRYEQLYRSVKTLPDPFLEFCLGWLRRNPPFSRGRESVIVWDTGQFHHQDGRVLAVLDVEIGHIGDPMMDLAAWRQRDTVLGFGNFAKLYDRYGELTGEPVDLDAIQRHHFMFTLSNQLPFSAALRQPAPDSDLMTNLQWCYETNLFATEALAEIIDVELPTVEMPDPRESRAEVVLNHLVRNLRTTQIEDEHLRYKLRTMFRHGPPRRPHRRDRRRRFQRRPRRPPRAAGPPPGVLAGRRGRTRAVCAGQRRHLPLRRGPGQAVPQAQPPGPNAPRPRRLRHGPPPPHPNLPRLISKNIHNCEFAQQRAASLLSRALGRRRPPRQ